MAHPDKTGVIRRPSRIYLAMSFAISGLFLYYSFRGLEWRTVWAVVQRGKPFSIAIAVAIVSLGLLTRAVRWRVLLSSAEDIPVSSVFWATSAGYLGNNVLPARAGELIRIVLISRCSGLSRAFILTTALCERVIDAVALIMISTVILLTLPTRQGWIENAARPLAVLGLLGVASVALVPALESFWLRFLKFIPIPAKLRDRSRNGLLRLLEGLRTLHDPSRLSRFLLLTSVVWFSDGTAAIVVARAVDISMSLQTALLLLAALGLASALPSTPGYVGIYQFVAVSVLVPFGIRRNDAIGYILLFQATTYVAVVLWGLLGISRQPARVTA